ncbi:MULTISPECIES: hypothetical protein [Streptomyces]|uniref:hypothetical protein n=1 Tax=Streptomyces TaxID=1883 RepID=UPI001E4F79CF|nr:MULTISPECIES: hypothetical protein [Streptomyces]UFQ16432.1 hypothetical protein J2N69_16265 [Streptomyces huasconensis]WCL86034.1 hypothetical protein PPN52_16275 [Streptomyces sp. JCM 35825]
MDDLREQLAELRVNDYVTAEGVDTRGHKVTRTGTLLAEPKTVKAQRNGTRTDAVRLFVGLAGTSPEERSTWVTLFPEAGSVRKAEEPKEWQNSELRMVPGVRVATDSVRFHFGGKGGKRSTEPGEPVVLAGVRATEDHRYEIYDVDTGDVLLVATLQTQVWWLPARSVEPEPDSGEPAEVSSSAKVSDPEVTVDRDLGKPVHHVRTGELVGYLAEDRFIPIKEVEAQ